MTQLSGAYLPLAGGTMQGPIILPNNVAIQGKTTGGVARDLVKVSAIDRANLGGGALDTQIDTSSTVYADQFFSKNTAKAWVNFNGQGTVSIRSVFNVSSITDNGVGDYTINFTNAFTNDLYCVVGASSDPNTGGSGYAVAVKGGTAPTTTSVRVFNGVGNGAGIDSPYINVAIFVG